MFVHCFLMLGTVLPAVCKPTAAGISTGTLWFVGHRFTSLSRHRKSPAGRTYKAWYLFYFADYTITQMQ
jgi:hypothetical protein